MLFGGIVSMSRLWICIFILYSTRQFVYNWRAVVFEYFGYGFWFCGIYAVYDATGCSRKIQMAHYAFSTGIMNLGFMIPSMLSGYFSDMLGYKIFFIWVLVATIPAFLAAYFVPFGYPDNLEQKELDNSTTN